MINIGFLGMGIVGSAAVEILNNNKDIISHRVGKECIVKTICVKDISKKRSADLKSATLTTNPDDVINDPEIDIVIEVIGGEFPKKWLLQALKNGKHVVTANKELISKAKQELIDATHEKQTFLMFEAAVGGGIPVIQSLSTALGANSMQSIFGILNGTTNFILTKIDEEGKDFDVVLKEAQDLGFAEANPHMDISGLDAAYKLDILAAIAFQKNVGLEHIFYEGIENIQLKDINNARDLGYKIKLLGIGKKVKKGFVFKVHPCLIPKAHPIASVSNEFNAIFVQGDAVGDSMLYGKGAGGFPTASAIVGDVIKIVQSKFCNTRKLESYTPVSIDDTDSKFYLRLSCNDTYGVIEKIAKVFSDNKISLEKFFQKDVKESVAELVFLTHSSLERNMKNAVNKLKSIDDVLNVENVLRVELDD